MSERRPTRRVVLGAGLAGVVAVLTGCDSGGGSKGAAAATGSSTVSTTPSAAATTTTAAPTTAPPEAWATEVGGAESSLVASYTTVIKSHPSLAKTLNPLKAAHAAHLAAVGVPATGKVLPGLPAGQAAALSRLAVAEQRASDLAAAHAITSPSQAAVLLGSIAASDASHILVLHSVGAA
jgi:hypothetical protein